MQIETEDARKQKNRPADYSLLYQAVAVLGIVTGLWVLLPAPPYGNDLTGLYAWGDVPRFFVGDAIIVFYSRKTLVAMGVTLFLTPRLVVLMHRAIRSQYSRLRTITCLLFLLAGLLMPPLVGRYTGIVMPERVALTVAATTYYVGYYETEYQTRYIFYECDATGLWCISLKSWVTYNQNMQQISPECTAPQIRVAHAPDVYDSGKTQEWLVIGHICPNIARTRTYQTLDFELDRLPAISGDCQPGIDILKCA